MPSIQQFETLGLTKVVNDLKKELSLREKMAAAYQKYRYLSREKLQAFNDKLKKESLEETVYTLTYKQTLLTPIAEYAKVPPDAVLAKLEAAQKDGCFDRFAVMTIQWVKEVKDPVLFGVIEGCSDLFYVAQWDDDLKIEDILKDHEGWRFLETKA